MIDIIDKKQIINTTVSAITAKENASKDWNVLQYCINVSDEFQCPFCVWLCIWYFMCISICLETVTWIFLGQGLAFFW